MNEAFLLGFGSKQGLVSASHPSSAPWGLADSHCTGQIEISAVGNPSVRELDAQGILPKPTEVCGVSNPAEGCSGLFLLFQQSNSSSFWFFLIIFFPALISLRDLIVSQVAHQVHSIGRLEKDALCIDE